MTDNEQSAAVEAPVAPPTPPTREDVETIAAQLKDAIKAIPGDIPGIQTYNDAEDARKTLQRLAEQGVEYAEYTQEVEAAYAWALQLMTQAFRVVLSCGRTDLRAWQLMAGNTKCEMQLESRQVLELAGLPLTGPWPATVTPQPEATPCDDYGNG